MNRQTVIVAALYALALLIGVVNTYLMIQGAIEQRPMGITECVLLSLAVIVTAVVIYLERSKIPWPKTRGDLLFRLAAAAVVLALAGWLFWR